VGAVSWPGSLTTGSPVLGVLRGSRPQRSQRQILPVSKQPSDAGRGSGDLRARPVFHHQREAIEAHLTVVFAALAVARHLQDATGTSIKKIVQTLRTARSATIEIMRR